MRKVIIVGNWKMNKDQKETENFLNEFAKKTFKTKENSFE